ncbi:MAG: SAM-dependent methyltransferase [Bacteroidales bacterium]
MNKGKLYLIPTPIGDDITYPLIYYPQDVLYSLDVFVVEELTTARRFLKKAGHPVDFSAIEFLVFNEQSPAEASMEFLSFIRSGRSVGLMSEAGMPCIADPGNLIVKHAHRNQIEVIPLPGPSSIFLALMASGGNGQQFSFHGYLPIEKNARSRKIMDLEKACRQNHDSQIFMETPYRNNQLTDLIMRTCRNDSMLCIACDLLSENQLIKTMSIAEWKKEKELNLHKRPVVFVLFYP